MAATQAYASGHGSPGRASGYGYPAYLAGDSEGLGLGLSEPGHTHASLSTLTASQARARARWHLSSLATLRPRLPEDSAIVLAKLRYDSVFARVHHVFLPILAYAHVPATIFLDYNAIYTLVQVALHPETDADGESRGGVRAAWWIAMGVYAAMFVIWLFGIVVAYEALWCFVRHWRTKRPLALPLYLSSPAFTLTAIKSFSLYSFLWRVRLSASRRDFFIESCWYYSQNWPTVLSLLPRAGLCAVLLVLFTPAGTTSIPASPRDDTYFDVDNSTLTTYAFAVLIINAGWAAWRLGVLFLAWLGLSVTLGFRALFARYRDEESRIENLRLDALHGSRSQGSGGRLVDWDESGTLHDTTSTGFSRLAWKARAEERIREALAIALPTVFSPSASEPIGSPAEHEAGLLSSAKAHERKRPDPRSPGLSEPSSHTLSPMVALSGTPNPSAFIPPMKPDAASASEYVEYVDEPETGDDRQREEGMGDGYDRLPLQSPGPEVERPMTLPSGLIVSMTDLPVLVHAQDRKRLSWNDSAQMLATNTSGLAMGTVRDPHSEAQPETSQDDSSSDERHESDVQMQRNSQISGSSQATGAPSISYPFPSKSTSPTKPACSESESHETGAGAGGSPSPDARSLLAPPTFVTAPASSAAEQAASQVVAQPISPLALSAQVPKTKPTRAERASSSFSSLASSLRVGGRGRSSSEAEAEGPGSDEGETAGSGTGGRGSKLLSAAGSLFSSSRSEHRASREGGDAWWAMGLGGRSNRGSDEQARQDNSPGSSTAGHAIASDADKTTPPLPSTSTPPTSSLKTDTVAAATAASSSGENEGNCHARPLPPSNTDANISHVEEQASPPSSPVSARTQDSVSALSESTDDSEERRLWASFPEQSRRHPPGLIALGLEQQAAASAAAAAAAAEAGTRTPTLGSSPVLSASPTGLREFGVLPDGQVSLSANVNANASAMGGDPSDATANANANAQKHPLGAGAPGGSALSTSPSKGGLRPIKEESWSSSLDSASGSTGSKNTNASSQGAPSRGASGASGT